MKEWLWAVFNSRLAGYTLALWLVLFIIFVVLILHLLIVRIRTRQLEAKIKKTKIALQGVIERFVKKEISDKEIIETLGGKNLPYLRICVEDLCFEKCSCIDDLRYISNVTGLTDKMRSEAIRGKKWSRTFSIRCLAYLGNHEDISLLKTVLGKDKFKYAMLVATTGLGSCNDEYVVRDIIQRIFDPKKPNRDMLLSSLTAVGKSNAKHVTKVLSDSSLHDDVISTLADVLGVWHYRPSRQILEKYLEQTKNPEVRLHIIEALEKVGDTSTCDKIIPHLKDEDFRVRLKAVNALERLAGDTYMNLALDLLLNDPDRFVKRNAAEAISRMGHLGMEKLESYKSIDVKSVRYVVKIVLAEKKYKRMRWRFRYADSIP